MTSLSDGTPAHICKHFIFLASILIGLHFATNDIGLSSLKFFWWAAELLFISAVLFILAVQGHPTSMNLVPIESAYVTSY